VVFEILWRGLPASVRPPRVQPVDHRRQAWPRPLCAHWSSRPTFPGTETRITVAHAGGGARHKIGIPVLGCEALNIENISRCCQSWFPNLGPAFIRGEEFDLPVEKLLSQFW